MCLGVPGRVTEIGQKDGVAMGQVDFGGVRREVCLAYVPDVQVGDYVIVHVGFALRRLSETEAQETLKFLQELEQALPASEAG
jgi:hydrogenase expression/formation protein HypC